MSDNNEMPVELVRLSYICLGESHAIRFTLHGVQQNLVLVPGMDPLDLVSALFKTIMVVADPVGPCVNEEPY
jgi:hypothetical protein